ncbi:MAG: hypothetical protein Q9201_002635 [Fulgogasparrea decipioides]
MAELNRQKFDEKLGKDIEVDIGHWCKEDGRLVRYRDAKNLGPILMPWDVLFERLKGAEEQDIKWLHPSAPGWLYGFTPRPYPIKI